MVKRSLTIQGHRTSLVLEPVFWEGLDKAAKDLHCSRACLVGHIDMARTTSLASAVRTWLYRYALTGSAQGVFSAERE